MGTKTIGSFWCGLPKIGVIQCAKLQFQAKIAKKLLNFSKCVQKHAKNVQIVFFGTKVEKRGHW